MVYEAYDRQEQGLVALKVLRTDEADALYRFKKDFRSLADLRHPNLVQFYELFTEDGLWFFSMELIDGVDFIEHITGRETVTDCPSTLPDPGPDVPVPPVAGTPVAGTPVAGIPVAGTPVAGIPVAGIPVVDAPVPGEVDDDGPTVVLQNQESPDYDQIRGRILQLARGLHAVHQHGKVHRDIKPSNILVTPEDRVVLLDFGLATELQIGVGPQNINAQMIGTPAYMSPEQALALPGTAACDWYSVGVILYQALAGELPFQGTLAEVLAAKQFSDPPTLGQRLPDLPQDLDQLCSGLLDPDPEVRIAGDEVLRRLEHNAVVLTGAREGPEAPFVGRQEILDELDQALQASRAEPVAVYLRGVSGIGKTALLQRFVERVQLANDEAVVLAGRCYLQESVPYKALDSLIDNLSRYLLSRSPEEVEALLPEEVGALTRLFPVLLRVEAVAAHEDLRTSERAASGLAPQSLRRRAFSALRLLLAKLAADRPLVLLIDDLQWGDAESFKVLEELFRPSDHLPLLLITCFRSEDEATSPFLRALTEHRQGLKRRGVRILECELGELSADESRTLFAAIDPDSPGADPEQAPGLLRQAGGSPLLLSELARHLGRQRRLGSEGTAAPSAPDRLPGADLRGFLRQRLGCLGPDSRRLIEAIAVAGKPLEVTAARRAAGLESGGGGALSELRAQRLVRQRTTQEVEEVEPYHDQIRETVLADLDPEALRTVHRRLALALESSGQAAPETLAVHFRGSTRGQATEEADRARAYALSAAERAEEALAFERAARLYRLALELNPRDGGERFRLGVRLGSALANAGHSHEAAEAYLGAIGEPEGWRSGEHNPLEVQRRAAEKLLISGRIDRGLAVLRHVLRHVDMELDQNRWKARAKRRLIRWRLRWRGLRFQSRPAEDCDPALLRRIDVCWSVEIGLCLVDVLHAAKFHARHLFMALEAGEPERVARALAMEIFFGAMDRSSRGSVDTARRLAVEVESRYASCLTEMAAGMQACSRGAWQEARECLGLAEGELRELRSGGAWELDTVHHFQVIAWLGLGRLDELFADESEWMEQAQDHGSLYLEIHLRHWVGSLRYLAHDRPDRARQELTETIARWSHDGFHYQHFGHLYAQVQVELYCGQGSEAWSLVRERWDDLVASGIPRIEMVFVQAHDLRARSALAAAVEDGGRRLLARAEADARELERVGSVWSLGLASLVRAGVAGVRGQTDSAESQVRAARAAFDDGGMALHRAVAERRLAELTGRSAELAAADRELRELGIEKPRRLAAVLAPGVWESAGSPSESGARS